MKRRITLIIIALIAVGIVIGIVLKSRQKTTLETVQVQRGSITQEVSLTGSTKPAQSVDLSFERTGRVSRVYVNVGDTVRAGQVLVSLDQSDLAAQLAQAQAGVAQQQAQLDELKKGTRPEQLQINEARVASAESAQKNAEQSLVDALNDTYTKCDDAVRNHADPMFSNPRSTNPQLILTVNDAQLKNDVESGRADVERRLIAWQATLGALTYESDLGAAAAAAQVHLSAVKTFMDKLGLAVNSANATADASPTQLDAWRADISGARSGVNIAVSSFTAADATYKNATAALTVARNELLLAQAGATPEQVAAQEAQLRQAQANAQSVGAQLGKTVLRSPINGVVTVQAAKLGQITTVSTASSANAALVSVISLDKLQIDANVPEVDIGHVSAGNPVDITFDALPGEPFHGTVAKVDPAETVVQGVVNYKVTVTFTGQDARVKSGLTANLSIKTAAKDGVLTLPQYAIVEKDAGTFVRVPDGGGFRDDPVSVGLRGADGTVEIVSGVTEGETVVNVGYKSSP